MPDAPPPVYNSNGTQVQEWLVVLRYDAARDALTLSWTQDAGNGHPMSQGATAHPYTDTPEFLEDVRRTVARLHAPRLW